MWFSGNKYITMFYEKLKLQWLVLYMTFKEMQYSNYNWRLFSSLLVDPLMYASLMFFLYYHFWCVSSLIELINALIERGIRKMYYV